jgi:hypothetical protein
MTHSGHPRPFVVTQCHLEERIAIRLEHIRKPTRQQEHQALNDTLKDLRETYGEIQVVQWPRPFDLT